MNAVIYQLVDTRSAGGIESHIYHLSRWLQKSDYQNEVIFMRDHGSHPLKAALSKAGLQWRCLHHPKELYDLLKCSNCLLSTHGYKAGIIGRLIARFTRTPVISTFHSGDKGQGKLRFYTWLDETTAFMADRVISVSQEISLRLSVQNEPIANFISHRPLQTTRGKAIAFIGRISHEKGPDLFGKATQNLNEACYVFGDGPLRDITEQQYPHLTFFGHVDMENHWDKIGLLCISSRNEGLPLVALEAMVRGIPVVSYDVGGLPDLIQHNRNGWLIPSGNIEAFRQAIRKWTVASPTQKAQYAIAAHHHISRHYTDDEICPTIVRLYQQAHLNAWHLTSLYR